MKVLCFPCQLSELPIVALKATNKMKDAIQNSLKKMKTLCSLSTVPIDNPIDNSDILKTWIVLSFLLTIRAINYHFHS